MYEMVDFTWIYYSIIRTYLLEYWLSRVWREIFKNCVDGIPSIRKPIADVPNYELVFLYPIKIGQIMHAKICMNQSTILFTNHFNI